MSNKNPFENQNPAPAEREPGPGEKLEGSRKKIWEKAKSILSGLGFDFGTEAGREKEQEIAGRLEEVEQMAKGEEYENEGDNLFLETEIEYQGKEAKFKMAAQSDPNYDPAYKIDFAKENPDFQKQAERLLKREAIIGQKLAQAAGGRVVSADTIEQAETKAGSDMYLLKTTLESRKGYKKFDYGDGRKLAETLFALQYSVDATQMVNEIMKEQGYGTQYELENEFSEDIFNDFDGYIDNSKDADAYAEEMEQFRKIIEEQQLGGNEYSLTHNNAWLDNIVVNEEGKALLKDWSNVGTTQNRELSIVNDLMQTFMSAHEQLKKKAEDFVLGVEDRLAELYIEKYGKEKGEQIAQAVIKLAKLRSFN